MQLDAALLHPMDDVATALFDLAPGTSVRVSNGTVERDVSLVERIATGHKFAVRDLGAGLRIRKYGEIIGRLRTDVRAGAWVHDHNLETASRRDPGHERAWSNPLDAPVAALGKACTTVGECPVYDERIDRLYWIDVRETPAIHAIDLRTGDEHHWPMAEDIGSIALTTRSDLVAGLRSGFFFFDPGTGTLTPIVDPEPDKPHNRANDGKCDPSGRFWCSTMNPESGLAEGALYVLEGDLHCTRMHGDYFTPNGLAWSLDGSTMYFADTRRGTIYAFAFDAASGTLGERRVLVDLGGVPGGPDGATIDADGGLWSAQVDGGCLIRYDAQGRMERVVRLPVSRPTACAFGGADYRKLFVTTSTRTLGDAQRRAEPLAGRLLVLDVGFSGLPPVPFAASVRRPS